jgi:hypothetical protein
MKADFEIRLLALTQDAQAAIIAFMQGRGKTEIFGMNDIMGDDPLIDIYAYPDFPNYDAEGPLEYAAIQSIRVDGENVYLTGVLKNDNFPDCVEVHLFDLDAPCSVALADYLYQRFL